MFKADDDMQTCVSTEHSVTTLSKNTFTVLQFNSMHFYTTHIIKSRYYEYTLSNEPCVLKITSSCMGKS